MKTLLLLVFATGAWAADGWTTIFDGKTLNGWKANERPGSWTVKDGTITGDGDASHLFYMGKICVNCEFKSEVKISDGGNSGMYFRTAFGPGFPKGYEAQVNSSHRDPVRSGSLYNFVKVLDQLVPPDTWFTQHIIADGNHIQIFVNDKKTVDYIDEKNTHTAGHLALQQHNLGSVVAYRNMLMKELPGPKTPLAGKWVLNVAQSSFSVGDLPKSLELRILEERDGIRYQSASVLVDGQKRGANYFARFDAKDYDLTGSATYDHVSIRPQGARAWTVSHKKGTAVITETKYTVSADGKALLREGTSKLEDGKVNTFKETLDKVE
ncbi:MAG TPA: DUF1080 domain-containing protein [Bryobacteraceae bacterium]|nr:DUF1080 domain-containing protein [Bryobacteraceae bacterium]